MPISALVALALALSAPLQDTPKAPPPSATESDDIVVTGLQDLYDPQSAVTDKTLGAGRAGIDSVSSRALFAMSARFAKCAIVERATVLQLLRFTLDGNVNSARQRGAYSDLVRIRATCAQDADVAQRTGIAVASTSFVDTSYYVRGALYVEALQRFAPDLRLTKAETNDPAVQSRFNAREIPKARFRLPVDRKYFEAAVCVVRMQPELAVRLVGPVESREAINRLEASIVNRSRICFGNAKHVYFDASQFRMYVADAVYRWAVAVKGVDSLVPAS